jgi:uncharacterized membrane protein
MYKLNLIAIVSIVAAVSFVVGMTAPAAFAQDGGMTGGETGGMTGSDMGSMTGGNMTGGNMTGGNMTMSDMSNATSLNGQ